MDDERNPRLASETEDVFEHGSMDDILYLGEGVGCWVKSILMLDVQFGQDRDAIHALVRLAAGSGLDPNKIAEFEKALFRIRIAGLAPCGKRSGYCALRVDQAALTADYLQSPKQLRRRVGIVFQGFGNLRCLASNIALSLKAGYRRRYRWR